MKIGFIGLGKMGKNMVLRQIEQGNQIVAWNRSPEPRVELLKESKKLKIGQKNLTVVDSIQELVNELKGNDKNIVIWLMVAAGGAIDAVIESLMPLLDKGDLIVDGGNSLYTDTLNRAKNLKAKGIHYMDVGTSGGLEGARNGACMMIGGSDEDFKRIKEVVEAAAAPFAFGHLGPVGSGHFAKTIHNGIEYGMMEAIGEGAAILKGSEFDYDLKEVFRVYNTESIIDSRLVNWTLNELKVDPKLKTISSVIGSAGGSGKAKGEGHWTVELAKKMGVGVPVIEASVKVRDNSDKDPENSLNGFRNKVVAAQRWQFGGHPVKKS